MLPRELGDLGIGGALGLLRVILDGSLMRGHHLRLANARSNASPCSRDSDS